MTCLERIMRAKNRLGAGIIGRRATAMTARFSRV
jgi:hypothetical protein